MTSRNLVGALGVCATLWLAGCSNDTTAPVRDTPAPVPEIELATAEVEALIVQVRQIAANRGVTALQRPASVRPALVQLGQALAFDKILSGNRDISCMTCHFPPLGTGDSRSVSVGQGATGLGTNRVHPQGRFVHRNAPPLFNLHALGTLTWDGRIFRDAQGVVQTPVGNKVTPAMQQIFEFGALSALPMFPVLSRPEMRASAGNPLAAVPDTLPDRVWQLLMGRLGAIPQYRTMFQAAYPGQSFNSMTFAHASNAMAGFFVERMAFTNSAWDRFLTGDNAALNRAQLRGARSFLDGSCARCHTGPSFTDLQFHNVALAQIGPGFGDGVGGTDDFGRLRVTGNPAERYRFRTPPLRNVELTAPYGHDGAIVALRAFVEHYSQSHLKLRAYSTAQLETALQGTLQPTTQAILATRSPFLTGVTIAPQAVNEITEFLKALTDPAARDLRGLVPAQVPSGIGVDNLP